MRDLYNRKVRLERWIQRIHTELQDNESDKQDILKFVNHLQERDKSIKKGGIAVVATEYIINDKDHSEFFNRKTIYSDLIDKLDSLKLVEPLDLRITTKTLDTVMDVETAANWNNIDNSFRETHPLILLLTKNILLTSIMLVLRKK